MRMTLLRSALLLALFWIVSGCTDDPQPKSQVQPSEAANTGLFADVTDAVHIDFTHHAGGSGKKYIVETMGPGAAVLDFDNDGWMDLYVVESGQIPGTGTKVVPNSNRLYRNAGKAGFVDVTAAANATGRGYGQGVTAGDYDNDGDTDLYLLNFGPNVLLRNEGNGTFSDATVAAGVGDPSWSVSGAFFDAEPDGDLDLFVVNYLNFTVATHRPCGKLTEGKLSTCHPDVYKHSADRFYRNRGDGTFEDASKDSGLIDVDGKGLGLGIGDLVGNDGLPDIFVANDSTPNQLYRNLGGGKFEEQGVWLGCSHNDDGKTEAGMGVATGDVNNDGHLDVYITNLSMETNALYLGSGEEFTYATRSAGLHAPTLVNLGFGNNFADLDNDSDLDIFTANGHVMDDAQELNEVTRYRQPHQVLFGDGKGTFTDLSAAQKGAVAEPRVGRGSVVMDYDNDGRLDIFVVHNIDKARLFRNQSTSAGHWIGFSLRGAKCNQGAVGARITVQADGKKQVREVMAGTSYASCSDPRLHFGIGSAANVEKITIRWPGGRVQELGPLPTDRYWSIVEGETPARR
ncbi:MAG: CRTAC1 family protein [Planctomycetes bacterium]|nr:CRTAC1 family protein [Planctomycetota bacterium]